MTSMTVTGSITGGTDYTDGVYLDVHVLTGAKGATSQPGAISATDSSTTDAGSASITTTTTGSWVFGSYADPWNSDPGITPIAGTTLIGNGYQSGSIDLCSFRLTNPVATPGAVDVGVSNNVSQGAVCLAEILPSATIAEDASTPSPSWVWTGDGSSDITETSAAFSPPPGSLIIAIVATDGQPDTVHGITDTQGLTWHQIALGTSGSGMMITIWAADVPGTAPTLDGLVMMGVI
jgi:hypothetical protein